MLRNYHGKFTLHFSIISGYSQIVPMNGIAKLPVLKLFFRNVRAFQKSTQTMAKELALKDAEMIRATKPKYFTCNRL